MSAGKLLFALVVGLVGAAIVHIAVIFAMPQVAANDAWGRLSRLAGMYEVVQVDALRDAGSSPVAQAEGSERHDFAFVDPAFVTASCRFSLAEGPVRLQAAETTNFWSASIYSRQGDNLYSINERSAVGGVFDLLVGSREQIEAAQDTIADPEAAIPVEVATPEGYLTLRALVDQESARPAVDGFIRSVSCVPLTAAPEAEAAPEAG